MQGGNDHGGNNPGAGQSQANALDPRLVGTWVNEKQINSGGGAGGGLFLLILDKLGYTLFRIAQFLLKFRAGSTFLWSSP